MHYRSTARSLPLLALFPLVGACAKGGTEDTPQSEVKIAASHHLFGFRSLPGFGTFPVNPEVVVTDRGVLNLFDDSTYTITRPSGTSGSDRYAMAKNGDFSVYVTGSGREPSVVFRGGYSLNDSLANYCFTDRVSTPSSQSIGLFYGTKVTPGQVELEGAWHVLSLHTVFGQTLLSPDNVGRAASGAVSIAAGAAGTARAISGTGTQSTSAVTFGGTIQNVLQNGTGDGTCNLTLNYQLSGQTADSRVMYAVASNNHVMALDADETDGEAGMVFLVRKFDAPTTPVDPVRTTGTFLVGGHTLFVNPTNCGSDSFVGTVTLGSGGAFRLDAVGNNGQDFSYTGTYTLSSDGGMSIAISGTNETWFGAIDREYNTFTFVDGFLETRSNNLPEINLGLGVRVKAN